MGKVKLPKEIANCIEQAREDFQKDYLIPIQVEGALYSKHLLKLKEYFFESNKSTPDILLEALVNDYEVEESPEDILLESYKKYKSAIFKGSTDHVRLATGVTLGIREALETLGIEIEGINKSEEENNIAKTV